MLEAGEARARIWRLYMAASALNFEAGKDPDPPGARGEERPRRERPRPPYQFLTLEMICCANAHAVTGVEVRIERPRREGCGTCIDLDAWPLR
jgi:hypothetical protein